MVRRALALLGAASIVGMAITTVPAKAASGQQIYIGEAGASTATWGGGPLVGNADPVGPPAPACTPGQCEQTQVTVNAPAGYTVANQVTLTASVTTDPNSPVGGSTWDIGILDSSGRLLAGSGAGTDPDTTMAANIGPGTYTVEVDGDIANGDTYVATATVTSVPRSSLPQAPQYTDGGIAFSTPTIVDPIRPGGEPDVGVNPGNGYVFASAPTGTGTQRSIWEASVDGGHTFRQVSGYAAPNDAEGTNAPPGGGDTEIAFSHDGAHQYFADLYSLTCLRVARTDDNGATVQTNSLPGGCDATNPAVDSPGSTGSAGAPADRQWYTVYDPPAGVTSTSPYTGTKPLVYMEYNAVASAPGSSGSGAGRWTKSTDGLTFTPATTAREFGADGYPSIDQVTGDVFEANYAGSTIKVNIGCPDSSGNLSFIDHGGCPDIPSGGKLITAASGVVNAGDTANFVVSSMDSGRNLWVAWVGRSSDPSQRQAYTAYASAASHWTQWSTPIRVSAPPSDVSVFPWVKGGGPGRADVVWYGSHGGYDANGNPPDPSTDAGQSWDVFMAQVTAATDAAGNADTTTAPSVYQAKVTQHPMHYNSICLAGTGCIASEGNRNLADFFEVNIDKTGAAEIVYDDTSNGLLQNGAPTSQQAADHAGAALVEIARQSAGPGLYGSDVSGTSSAPVSGMTDNAGDALYPVIGGTNVPALDLTNSQLALSGDASQLTVTTGVADLSSGGITSALQAVQGPFLQYVTRWQMGNTIYYALAETTAGGQWTYSAGTVQSIDLCSVSACDPHLLYFPETGPGAHSESGSVTCPDTPSATAPCTISITIPVADVGTPTGTSLLEEVGAYSFSSTHPQAEINNAQAQADNVPLEIDGICCYNFAAAPATDIPETPVIPAFAAIVAAVLGGEFIRRRRSRRAARSH